MPTVGSKLPLSSAVASFINDEVNSTRLQYTELEIIIIVTVKTRSPTMASSMLSTTAAAVNRSSPAQATMVAPFIGLKSLATFPITRKNVDITSLASNGCRVSCMQVWPTEGLKKFETLSYLPPLTREQLLGQIEYLLRNKWIPCLEFELKMKDGFPHRENNRSPGYYDGRYWTMWKLPMFGCTEAGQVANELDEVVKAHPNAFVRIIGFDNVRQVQCVSFIAHKPEGI